MHEIVLLSLLIFAAALLYSSVGQAGASGYLAAMALMGVAPEVMKPAALFMNILVATIGTFQFYRAGCFSWRLFLPFAFGAIPFAFLGGFLTLPTSSYKQALGIILLFAAYPLFLRPRESAPTDALHKPMFFPIAIACGAGIGLLSGLTGTGGGIFLTPLLLFMGWAEAKESAGVSVAFILVNSVAGILGHLSSMNTLPSTLPIWATAAVLGGIIGSRIGSRRLGSLTLRRLLAVVLVIAGVKLLAV